MLKNYSEIDSTEKKLNPKGNKADICFIIVLIILTILFPFGVLFYVWGRMNLMFHIVGLISLLILFLMLIFLIAGILAFLRKNPRKKKILTLFEMLIPAVYIISSISPINIKPNLYDSSNPFLCGYRDRIRSRLDIPAVRDWMKTFYENNPLDNPSTYIDEYIPYDSLPDCLKPISYGGVFKFFTDRDGNPEISQFCGGGMSHWSLTIGMKDAPFPDSEYYEEHALFWLPVAPGIYVEMD